jgi:hypothetical protein
MNGADHSDRVTAFQRICATPFRDLLRGRINGRLDVNILASDAGMPPTLRGVIRETVRRTRLLRLEKSEVASELIAHFRDGLTAGHSADALIASFGDSRIAARLIRRAKKRDRSLPLKATIASFKALGVLVLVLVVTYAVLAARYYGVKRGPVVDYLPQFTAAARAVPEDQRAWPIYRQALLDSQILSGDMRLVFDARPGWRDWPAMAEHLRTHRDTLERFRQGATLDGLGLVPGLRISDEDIKLWPDMAMAAPESGLMADSMIGILLPQLGSMRSIAGFLVADARLAVAEGDGERAARNLIAVLRMAHQLREIPLLINDLVAMSIASHGTEEALQILYTNPVLFSDDDLRDLAHLLAGYPGDGEPLVRLEGERLFFEDVVQRLYSLDSDGNGVMVAGSLSELESLSGQVPTETVALNLAGPVASAVIADRKRTLQFNTDYFASAEAWIGTPAWERTAFDDPLDRVDTAVGRARYALAHVLTPAIGRALRQGEQFEQRRNAAFVAIAVELFRRAEGRPPTALSELTPRFLPRVPIDMFDGAPLKYRVQGDSFVIYSIGNDYIDDDGRAGAEFATMRWLPRTEAERRIALAKSRDPETIKNTKRGYRAPSVGDGDWVFFPPAPMVEPPPRDEYEDEDPLRPQPPDDSGA